MRTFPATDGPGSPRLVRTEERAYSSFLELLGPRARPTSRAKVESHARNTRLETRGRSARRRAPGGGHAPRGGNGRPAYGNVLRPDRQRLGPGSCRACAPAGEWQSTGAGGRRGRPNGGARL